MEGDRQIGQRSVVSMFAKMAVKGPLNQVPPYSRLDFQANDVVKLALLLNDDAD